MITTIGDQEMTVTLMSTTMASAHSSTTTIDNTAPKPSMMAEITTTAPEPLSSMVRRQLL